MAAKPRNEEKLVGKVFGCLTVLRFDKEKTIATKTGHWVCSCNKCGKECGSFPESFLKNKKRTSCGCETRNKNMDIVNNLGLKLLEEYFRGYSKRVILKDNEGYMYDVSLYSIVRNPNVKLEKIHKNNPYSLENINLWLKKNNKRIELCKENVYIGDRKELKFFCLDCEDYFYEIWGNLRIFNRCNLCGVGRHISEKKNFGVLNPKAATEWVSSEHGKTPYEVSNWSREMVLWRCSKCGHEWESEAQRRNFNIRCGCPMCAEKSNGAKEVMRILNKYNIINIPEYIFKDCRGIKRPLPFDFYLPNYGILIEYDGILHFIDKFKRPKEFEDCQRNDQIKNQYCLDNNIPLLRIHYKEFNNIENIIVEYLCL